MALIKLLLSPGSAICRHYGIDPQSDAGLMRWMINTFLPLRRLDHHLDRGSLMTPRIDIARSDIEQVVHAFYARVRAHPVLAQVFSRHVDDWSAHEEKITRFWANALLFEGDYDGNPMQAHMQAQTVKPVHFDHWLSLFDDTLVAELPSQPAIQ